MKARLGEAFISPYRINRWRFVVAHLTISTLVTAISVAALPQMSLKPPYLWAVFAASEWVAISGLLLLANSVAWWILTRLNFRGWASSMLAGALTMNILFAPAIILAKPSGCIGAAGCHVSNALMAQISIVSVMVISLASVGVGLGWFIWRISFVASNSAAPDLSPDTEVTS